MSVREQLKGTGQFIFLFFACSAVFLVISQKAWSSGQVDQHRLNQWAGTVCRDLGCMSIGTRYYGVNMTALGLLRDRTVLEGYGFVFGKGDYRISATRIDTGRYRVRVQAMSRPNDNAGKVIMLKTKADDIYPVSIPPAPAGKYTWNAAIQFDMEDQLGIIAHSELEAEPVSFVNLRVIDPAKFAAAGFKGYRKNDTSSQIIYKGKDTWEFNPGGVKPGGGILVYQNGQWSSKGEASMDVQATGNSSHHPEPPIHYTKNSVVFLKAAVSDMTHNKTAFEWNVFRAQVNDRIYYLVSHPEIGTALIDIHKGTMADAESARALPDGIGMVLDMNDITLLDPSGVQQSGFGVKKIKAWWDNDTLSFILKSPAPNQSSPGVPAQETASSNVQTVTSQNSVQSSQLQDPTLLFANSDFEMGDLTNWTADGTAFDFQPTKGDNPTARGRKSQPSGHQGQFWIGTFEKYQGTDIERPGMLQGDRPTGILTSVMFEIKADRISFLVGGGKYKDKEMVSLVVDSQPVLSVAGKRNESMERTTWDVSAYRGKSAHIEIKDTHKGGWGHINADDFRYAD